MLNRLRAAKTCRQGKKALQKNAHLMHSERLLSQGIFVVQIQLDKFDSIIQASTMNPVDPEPKAALSKLIKQSACDEKKVRRRGFLAGQISIPADFDHMESDEIEKQFSGDL